MSVFKNNKLTLNLERQQNNYYANIFIIEEGTIHSLYHIDKEIATKGINGERSQKLRSPKSLRCAYFFGPWTVPQGTQTPWFYVSLPYTVPDCWCFTSGVICMTICMTLDIMNSNYILCYRLFRNTSSWATVTTWIQRKFQVPSPIF